MRGSRRGAPSIVRSCDGVELLLPRGVPHHEPHVLAKRVDVSRLLEEIHADGLLVLVGEVVPAEALHHGRLPHRAVAHDEHLDLLLERLLDLRSGKVRTGVSAGGDETETRGKPADSERACGASGRRGREGEVGDDARDDARAGLVRTIATVALDPRSAARGALCVLSARRRRHSEGDVATFTKLSARSRSSGVEVCHQQLDESTGGWVPPRALFRARARPLSRRCRRGVRVARVAPSSTPLRPETRRPDAGNALAVANSPETRPRVRRPPPRTHAAASPSPSRGRSGRSSVSSSFATRGAFPSTGAPRWPLPPFPTTRDPPRVPTRPDPRDDPPD